MYEIQTPLCDRSWGICRIGWERSNYGTSESFRITSIFICQFIFCVEYLGWPTWLLHETIINVQKYFIYNNENNYYSLHATSSFRDTRLISLKSPRRHKVVLYRDTKPQHEITTLPCVTCSISHIVIETKNLNWSFVRPTIKGQMLGYICSVLTSAGKDATNVNIKSIPRENC